ncbi:MAG: DUF3473 domain-containing protein [Planctomycetota bacterium]|jgi:polysaccharide deacetylase family protein (PEP-CTERM system associated)
MIISSKNTATSSAVNALSVDVEGFVESNIQSFHVPEQYIDQAKEDQEIQVNTEAVLEVLAEAKTKGTFFFIGRLAKDIPGLVRKVAEAGHEIGCHNYLHLRVFNIEQSEFKENITAAKKNLEDVSGRQVYGFRAPDFSITEKSLWALDILEEAGFIYDSSIYPFGLHDVYGIKDAKPAIHRLPNDLIEFPMSTFNILGRRIPFGGGGYFRLFPLFVTKYCISKINRLGFPSMFYIHPYEVGPSIPEISGLSLYRKFRHYHNCKNGDIRLSKILRSIKFSPAIEVLRSQGFAGD